ncbi:MAG: pilus assembly protein N-terminal domain-containing protein [Candidatus Omnitrophica bacterium]|nr:pilus assembly protein N-terminal domain-containing protein [Candidatus Omnitrophota bacterium]
MTIRWLIPAFIVISHLLFLSPVIAYTLTDYEYCLLEGRKAFERGDDVEATRYFELAHRLMPLDTKPYTYLQMIAQRQTLSDREDFSEHPSVTYEDLMKRGQDALGQGDREEALDAFYKALIMNEYDPRPLEYINLIKRLKEDQTAPVGRARVVAGALDQFGESAFPSFEPPEAPPVIEEPLSSESELAQIPRREAAEEAPVPTVSDASASVDKAASDAPVSPRATFVKEKDSTAGASDVASVAKQSSPSVPVKKAPTSVETISLVDVMKGGARPGVLIDLWAALKLEGQNIQRFLVMDPAVVEAKIVTKNQIQINALKRGTTFIHIWDDAGRSTINVDVIIPQPSGEDLVQLPTKSEHARPFRVVYATDWGSYYYGDNIPNLERRSLSVQQSIGVDGETPYGDFDASGGFSGYGKEMYSTTYTMGLTGVPIPGTTNFNVRIFDDMRHLSSLTLPGVRLRGGFIDTNLFKDTLGVSLTQGRFQPSFFSYFGGSGRSRKAYIDALGLTLYPNDPDNQISLNYARDYGPEREDYLTKQAFSLEGRKKIDKFRLSGEVARDDHYVSSLSGIHWADDSVRTGVNFRNINKNFTTVTNAPSGLGEIGATWTGDATWEKLSANAALDVFQDKLNPSLNNPQALNYDTSAHVRVPLNEAVAVDVNGHYIDNPGQASPRRFQSGDGRVSANFDVWGGREGTVFTGGAVQRSRYAYSAPSEYDRCSLISGVQVPLAKGLDCYANYEYSWLFEPYSGLHSNPNVMNAGMNYNRELTRKMAGNFGIAYRNEDDMRGTNSFLAGEDSLMFSSGLSFTPVNDVNVFLDGRLRNVWAQIPDNPSYNDLDLRIGMRMALGTSFYWDPKGGISGFVFKDKDGDGRFTIRQDEGIPGVKVKVGDQEVVTDEKGWYRAEVRSKKVTVTPALETIAPGFVFSTPASAEVDIFQGISKRVDFGLTTQSGIYGVVFVDKNGNGAPDKDDQFVGRVMFSLDGTVKQISDSRGAYFFKNVSPGKHTLVVDMRSLPIEFIPLVKLKIEVNVAEGTTYISHIPLKVKPQVITPSPKTPLKE